LIAREKAVPRQKIEHLLSEVLREGRPVTLRSVAQKIGLITSRRLYKGFHKLRKAIVAQNKLLRQQLRLQRQTTIKEALQAALIEVPVPSATAISRRLGYKSVSAITRSFPEQCAALKSIARNAFLINRGHS
jgi:AraC-like DNA-binding protein